MPSKTIKQWLCELPQPYKKQALKNTTPEKKKKEVESLGDAINYAMTWDGTPEGHSYWENIKYRADSYMPITHESP